MDPGRGLGDISRIPYTFNHMWAVHLNDSKPVAYKISLPESEYAKAILQTDLERTREGEFKGTTRLELQGELANFMKAIFFKEGEEGFRRYLEAFAPVSRHRGFTYRKVDFVERNAKNLRVELSFISADSGPDQQKSLAMTPHYLPFYSREKDLSFPDFPMQINEVTTVKDAFVLNEEKFDCTVRGPLASITRRVENISDTVVIRDEVSIPASEPPALSDESQGRLGAHARGLARCASAASIPVLSANADQKSFSEMLDLSKPYIFPSGIQQDSAALAVELRKIEAYLKADSKDESLWRDRGRIQRQLGYVAGDTYIIEYLKDAQESFLHAIELKPMESANYGQLGINYLCLGDLGKGVETFNKTAAVENKSYWALQLGGLISRRTGKFDLAVSYFASAAAYSQHSEDKAWAVIEEAATLCQDMKRCEDALGVHDKIVAIEPRQVGRFHAAAVANAKEGHLEKAVMFEREELKRGDLAEAKNELFKDLIAISTATLGKSDFTKETLSQTEKYLHEAYNIDSKSENAIALLVSVNAKIAKLTGDQTSIEEAQHFLAELKELSGQSGEVYTQAASELKIAREALPPVSADRIPSSQTKKKNKKSKK